MKIVLNCNIVIFYCVTIRNVIFDYSVFLSIYCLYYDLFKIEFAIFCVILSCWLMEEEIRGVNVKKQGAFLGLFYKKNFAFTLVGLTSIHRRIFEGIFKFAGQIRDYNITKREWVLRGDTVLYVSAPDIRKA